MQDLKVDAAKKNGEPQRDKAGGPQGDKGKQERSQSKGDKSDAQSKANKGGERNAGEGDDTGHIPRRGPMGFGRHQQAPRDGAEHDRPSRGREEGPRRVLPPDRAPRRDGR